MALKGKVYHYRDLAYWAWGGIVRMADESDGSQVGVFATEFMDRAKALKRMIDPDCWKPGENQEMRRAVEEMTACVREARHQGDPDDPHVINWFLRHRPVQARVAVPAGVPQPGKTKKHLYLPASAMSSPQPSRNLAADIFG